MSSTRVVVHLANHVGAICITESLSTRKFSLVLAIVENMSILTSSEHASMNVYRAQPIYSTYAALSNATVNP